MSNLAVSTEFQYKVNGTSWYKVYVSRPDGSMVKGSRTINCFCDPDLAQVIRQYRGAIKRGAWSNEL